MKRLYHRKIDENGDIVEIEGRNERMEGILHPLLFGDFTNVSGKIDGVIGECDGMGVNLDSLNITDQERADKVSIIDLIYGNR